MEKPAFIQEFLHKAATADSSLTQDRLQAAAEFFYLLQQANQIHNLTGFHTLDEFYTFHFCDTLHLFHHLELNEDTVLTDIGTGSGIPGFLLKLLYPPMQVCLVESIQKKIQFLTEMREHFRLERCHLLADRAETLAHLPSWREQSSIVVARALSSLSSALELTCPFARIGGVIALPRGSRVDAFEQSQAEIPLGCVLQKEIHYSLPQRDTRHRLLIYKKMEKTPVKYPRKPGQIKKRPL
ncbi:MAG: 16S rRNA (guanine(527)-N(7))-methyltransferase RsmG [bacterium]|jgi:16S rRNA (guanine527-N7)-methyltransferase|nr:16S rRNA (guanine(527)-N(7))-methyltransferase RsmG [bacterium]